MQTPKTKTFRKKSSKEITARPRILKRTLLVDAYHIDSLDFRTTHAQIHVAGFTILSTFEVHLTSGKNKNTLLLFLDSNVNEYA